jgi:FAD/FMN-containing dehydrogenase
MVSRRSVLQGAAATAACAIAPRIARTAPRTIINDASRLNPTPVVRHVQLTSPPLTDLVARVRAELKDATSAKRPVAVGVARHSMGGQSLPNNGTAFTLDGGPIELDTVNKTYRTGAGARWSHVVAALDPKGFSPAVMQSNHDFGVGSTFCVNAHGWPTPYGPFGSTVRAMRMVLADGSLVNCSRTENAELFGLAMGGYGLFGVIVELDVDMVPNLLLAPTYARMPAEAFAPAFIKTVETEPDVKMAYGRLSVARDGFFDEALMISYRPVAPQPATLTAATSSSAMTEVQRRVYRAQTGWEWAKRARWFVESNIEPSWMTGNATRNSLINEPVVNLAQTDVRRTDILHEYFVPAERFVDFLKACRDVIPKAKAEFLNVTLRYVAADPTAMMAFAPGPRIAAVMSFSQEISPEGEVDMIQTTEALIEYITAIGGAFYLPYRLHARRDQVAKAYPHTADFVAAKRRFDPNLTFRNAMWDAYFA